MVMFSRLIVLYQDKLTNYWQKASCAYIDHNVSSGGDCFCGLEFLSAKFNPERKDVRVSDHC